jgi:hypothetical protein
MKLKALLLCSLLNLGLAAVAFGQGSTSPSSQDPSMQSPPAQSPSTQAPSTTSPSTEASPTSSSSAAGENTFTGSVAKSGGKYILHAAEGDFKLDDQAQARSFEGKDVKVTGTLDSKGRTIKVKSIEPASK